MRAAHLFAVLAAVAGGCASGTDPASPVAPSSADVIDRPVTSTSMSTGASPAVAPVVPAVPSDTGPAPQPAGELVEVLADGLGLLLESSGADGGIVGYRRGGGVPVVVTAGVIDASGTSMTAGRPFPIASVTKSFTAALLVELAADGRVDLDAPISTWIEWPDGERITVRQLLTHTSGIGPWAPSGSGDGAFDAALFADLGANHTLADVIDLGRGAVSVGPPGGQTFYSTLNYVLAGRIAEVVTGVPYARLLADHVTDPLGLVGTSYPVGLEPTVGADPLPGTFEFPVGTIRATTDFPQEGLLSLMGPAAGAMSTVDDLFEWGDALFRSQRLGDVDLGALVTIGTGGYGLGVIGVDRELGSCVFTTCPDGVDFEYLGLNGELPGSAVRLWYDPMTDATLLVYLNRDGTSLDRPLLELLARIAAAG